ncbi:MAG TPA: hypothetical protein VKA60_01605 [Blastocatellia bacterium]|nr:hypothetical protein [Blastocatellia bacterium]
MVPHREETLEQLDRLLHSRILHGSESLKAFLKFVVTKSVEDHETQLKEYTIATEVFGRGTNYDSRNDSVVRVQAGRLRAKLQEYYATEGKDDPVLIDLPKGHYNPAFTYLEPPAIEQKNGALAAPVAMQTAAAQTTVAQTASAHTVADRRNRYLIAGLVAVCLLLGGLAVSYAIDSSRLKGAASSQAKTNADVEAAMPLWSDFMRSSDPVMVAFSNARFEGTAETGMRLLKPMSTPSGNAAAGKEAPPTITEHYTGVGEVMGVYAMGDFFHRAGRSMRVKRSLLLTWDDLKANDIVILGSPAENDLLRDLPQQQDFVFRMTRGSNDISAFGVVNTKPAADEQSIYLAKQEGPSRSQISEDYAVISLLKGLDENRRLLILAGITTFGTQAAAEYVTRPEHIKDLIAHLNVAPPGEPPRLPPFFQVLVKVKVNGGVPVQISYVAHHVL